VALDIIQSPSPNYGYPRGQSGRNGQHIQAICDHIMQGHMAGYFEVLDDPNGNAANYSIGRDGVIRQHVMDWCAAWCNGPMHSPDLSVPFIANCYHHHINPNLLTVSIEHEGMSGELLTDAQLLATIALHKHLCAEHHIPADRQHIVGHYQIDGINKARCPGTAFPWLRIIMALQR
jgi:N-acetylmuramoyl-L-alanine amidase